MTLEERILHAVWAPVRELRRECVSVWLMAPNSRSPDGTGWKVESRSTERYKALGAPYGVAEFPDRPAAERFVERLIATGDDTLVAQREVIWQANLEALAASADRPSDDDAMEVSE